MLKQTHGSVARKIGLTDWKNFSKNSMEKTNKNMDKTRIIAF